MELVTGPVGFPMSPEAARRLEAKLGFAHDPKIKRAALDQAQIGPWESDRSEISWISTERVDHEGDLVLASGMDDSVFALNPIVTFNHNYETPPVGKSLWRRALRAGGVTGILAATHYPRRPRELPADGEWMPDRVVDLVRAGLAVGKSIGFIARETRGPTPKEKENHPGVIRVIERWLLLEYAVCWLPANPGAVLQTDGPKARPSERLVGKFQHWVIERMANRMQRKETRCPPALITGNGSGHAPPARVVR